MPAWILLALKLGGAIAIVCLEGYLAGDPNGKYAGIVRTILAVLKGGSLPAQDAKK